MNTKASKNTSLSTQSTSNGDSTLSLTPLNLTEDFIITLIPCEYDPTDGYDSPSEDSIDSSEIIDSSDDELETIKINEIYKTNEQLI